MRCEEVAQVRCLVGRGREHQEVANRVLQQFGGERKDGFRAVAFGHHDLERAGWHIGVCVTGAPSAARPLRARSLAACVRAVKRSRWDAHGAPGESCRERVEPGAEGQAANDALAVAGQAPQERFQVVGRDAGHDAVAVVQDDRAQMFQRDGAVVHRAKTVGGHEKEIGPFGKVPLVGQGADADIGGIAQARQRPRQFGRLALARAEHQADRRARAALEPVEQGGGVGHHRAAARSRAAEHVVAARNDRYGRRLEGGRRLDPLCGERGHGLGAEWKRLEGGGVCHAVQRPGTSGYAGSPEPGPPASPYS